MGVSYLAVSAVSTAFSFVGLQYQAGFALDKLRVDRLVGENFVSLENANNALGQLLDSYATAGLLSIFFVDLYPSETRKLAERLVNYVIYKGTFLPLVIPPTVFQVGLWLVWLTIMCSLKMFQALARDRLERLNASPSALPSTYFRVYSALLFVLSVDLFWIRVCLGIYRTSGSPMLLLLFFEPLSIAFETMQAMLVHGFQLLDIWHHHSAGDSANCQRFKFFDSLRAGSLWEWKGTLTRNVGFALDMATLLMALGHYVHIWWLHGVAFHLVDAILFLNIRALLSAIIKRVKGFIKLRMALGALHAALPDATSDELRAYDDECAICREPMARAKRLHCSHLFHLPCLRSWLDQGLNDMYSCPTCRKPLFLGRTENETSPRSREVLSDEQLARQISERDQQTNPGNNFPVGAFPNQAQNPTEGSSWRSTGLDPSWLPPWPNQGLDGAGPSNAIRSVGLGRVQMMMRHIASVGETYAQTALEDAAWSLWPMNPSQATTSSSSTVPPPTVGRYPAGTGGLQIRTPTRLVNDNMANLLAMANTVHEVLPHIPDELILEDLQRTNSVAVTVNNLLQM
ncbi:E3 ubiquitin protein ligase RIN2 [Linum perenne]